MERYLRGAAAGLLATGPMSLVMLAGRALNMMIVPPPVEITARAEERAGVSDELPREWFGVRWLGAHFGYGAFLGALYALAAPLLPRPAGAGGLLYGGALWILNYLGAMPALGLYPWPKEDSRSRAAVMVVAHLVFGAATSVAYRRLRGR